MSFSFTGAIETLPDCCRPGSIGCVEKNPSQTPFLISASGARKAPGILSLSPNTSSDIAGCHIPQVSRDGLGAGCWRHSSFLMLLKVQGAASHTQILLCQWGGEGVCSCSCPSPGSAGTCAGTTRTRQDPRKSLALLELMGVLHRTSARSRILPKEY